MLLENEEVKASLLLKVIEVDNIAKKSETSEHLISLQTWKIDQYTFLLNSLVLE